MVVLLMLLRAQDHIVLERHSRHALIGRLGHFFRGKRFPAPGRAMDLDVNGLIFVGHDLLLGFEGGEFGLGFGDTLLLLLQPASLFGLLGGGLAGGSELGL